jgi:hypothetical protein
MKTVLPVLAFTLAAMCPQLEASSLLPACATDSLLDYEDSSGCVLGGGEGGVLVFSGFAFSVSNPNSAPVLDASEIELTPDPSGLGGSFTFGTTGGPGFDVPASDTITYGLDYFFLIDPGPIVGGASLHGDPPTGNVVVTESICADSQFVSGQYQCESNGPGGTTYSTPQSLSIGTLPPYSLDAEISLNPPAYNFGNIQTVFTLTGGTTGSTLGSLTSGNTVYVVPEPVTSLLCLGGLIAIGIFRRRLIT